MSSCNESTSGRDGLGFGISNCVLAEVKYEEVRPYTIL